MKFKTLSVKRLFGRVAIGLVLSMSGITIALFLVTKQTAVLLTGGALLLCALVGIFVLTQAFGKRLSQFTTDLCQTLDHMIAGNEAPQRPEDSETQLARIGHRLALTVSHDSKWTSEALFNLLDNAVKYTPAGGKIAVSVVLWEMYVEIKVTDTGKGISESKEEVHEQQGVGIGLYLAREIVTRQGGYIKVVSEPGKGSEFSIMLPTK